MAKFLDCFCGMGGASEGFHREGFECTGIDIVDVGYPYKLILKDMLTLDGSDFKGYDVIWGSPPCRDFVNISDWHWKEKQNPKKGVKLVNCFLSFVKQAKPRIWIMENVKYLAEHISLQPQQISWIGTPKKVRAFWGNFPNFLMPLQELPNKCKNIGKPFDKMRKWERAKIPLACSLAFAQACKQQLLKMEIKNG